ncbi:hypothetical protein AWC26_10900 [Mycobacterium shimoidei]|nr:hypothetical protein BHQ16_05225 [Mycobacterium shimoidei]ORW80399.1 hypothetical protein AWC26_10900 [Mycobacterium shimoidei]
MVGPAFEERAMILRRNTGLGLGATRGQCQPRYRDAGQQRTGCDPCQGVAGVHGWFLSGVMLCNYAGERAVAGGN